MQKILKKKVNYIESFFLLLITMKKLYVIKSNECNSSGSLL